mgnify:CR=1 FL=1|jgi:RNA polymerase primary sigma factor|tara:strand:- start:51 stop:542 length:492 start_codon:yes stop_codon:yes gene_type:complete
MKAYMEDYPQVKPKEGDYIPQNEVVLPHQSATIDKLKLIKKWENKLRKSLTVTEIKEREDYQKETILIKPFIHFIDRATPLEYAENENLNESTRSMLGSLTPREAKVLELRFGINSNVQHSLRETGKMFDVSPERIRQIEARALRKLRHPSMSEQLKEFLDLE